MWYKKFKGLDLGPVVKYEAKWQYYQDLQSLEASLVCGNALGCVKQYPFHFEVLDPRPLHQKPIVYLPEKHKWINDYLWGQVELGTLREITRADKDPQFISSVVLIEDGQSGAAGKTYRLTPNLAEANTRVQLPAQHMEECGGVLDKLQGAKLLSALDVKAAFNNIPLPTYLEQYCGIIMQDVLMVYTVMAWGFNAAPCHY